MSRKIIITNVNEKLFLADFDESGCRELSVLSNSNESNIQVGNVYVGYVENVVKNINAAFVQVAKGITCYYPLSDNRNTIFLNKKNNSSVNIGDLVLVQVCREAIKTKPATVTSKIEISGKYVVVSADVIGVTVSSKLKKNPQIKELKLKLISRLDELAVCENGIDLPGIIVRTNAAEADCDIVLSEAQRIVCQFMKMLKSAQFAVKFQCMYKTAPEYCKYINDIRINELEKIVTDIPYIYKDIQELISDIPKEKINLYDDDMLALHKLYSLETIIEHATVKKKWLKSGGYLIIEQTEAMVVIDVNSGKQISTKSKSDQSAFMEAAIKKTNTEAAIELTRQLRLRNLSGIIIVDFINMKSAENNSELMSLLKNLFKDDPITTTVVDITKLGLVEITRKKSGKSLSEALADRS